MVNCLNKKRYSTERMADKYANDYNKDPFLKEEEFITPYHCPYHDGWHVGHTKTENLPPHIKVHRLLDEIKTNEA